MGAEQDESSPGRRRRGVRRLGFEQAPPRWTAWAYTAATVLAFGNVVIQVWSPQGSFRPWLWIVVTLLWASVALAAWLAIARDKRERDARDDDSSR